MGENHEMALARLYLKTFEEKGSGLRAWQGIDLSTLDK